MIHLVQHDRPVWILLQRDFKRRAVGTGRSFRAVVLVLMRNDKHLSSVGSGISRRTAAGVHGRKADIRRVVEDKAQGLLRFNCGDCERQIDSVGIFEAQISRAHPPRND